MFYSFLNKKIIQIQNDELQTKITECSMNVFKPSLGLILVENFGEQDSRK